MSKLDYCIEPYKSPNVHATKEKEYVMDMIGSFPQQIFHFQLLLYHGKFYEKDLLL